jgi:hypothetical protein
MGRRCREAAGREPPTLPFPSSRIIPDSGQTEGRFEMAEVSNKNTLSGWWGLISVGVGLAVAILFGRFSSDGSAEISGILAGSFTLCVRAFWNFRLQRWFIPLLALWIFAHISVFFVFIVPLELVASKSLIMIVWLEFFGFAGLLWIANRLWGDPSEA